jgi:peptide/nickel transport system substrate-binding protein
MFGKREVGSILLVLMMVASILAACGPTAEPVATTAPEQPAPEATTEPAAPPEPGQEDLLDQVLAAGKLVVSTDPNYAPQSFINDAGELDGFDVNVAQEVARRLGVDIEFVTPEWDLITAGNWGGRWDLSVGSMTPTEPRAEVLWFTDPYYYTPASFAVHRDNTDIQDPADLAGKTVGLGTATTYEDYLQGTLAIMGGQIMYDPPSGIQIQPYSTDAEAIEDLQLGDGVRLDAVMSAQPTIQNAIDQGLPLKYIGTPAFYEPLAFALDKSRSPADQMLARLNEIVAEMHADGTLADLSLQFYGIDITTLVTPGEEPAPVGGGGTFIFGRGGDSVQLDPALVTDGESFRVTGQCLEPLYQYEPGSTLPIPALATECTANEDSTEWTCALREGVSFHDGTPFNADAVIFNFERWRFTDHPHHYASQVFEYYEYMWGGFDDASMITGVEAVDEYTVKFTLNAPLAPFLANLAMDMFAISSPAAFEQYGEDYGLPSSGCVGTGPFKFVEWVEGDHIRVEANDDYWGGRPTIDEIVWRVIPDDSARFLALQAGDIHGLEQALVEDLAAAEADPSLYVVTRPALNTAYLAFNYKIEEMRDPNFRKAVVHAIDRQSLVDSYYGTYGEVATNFLPPLAWGHNDTFPDWPYSTAMARQFLADAGFPHGISEVTVAEDVRDSEGNLIYSAGQKIPLRLYYMPINRFYSPSSQEVGAAMVDDLADAGLNATLELAGDWATYLGLRREGLLMGLYMLGWGGDNGDPDNFHGYFFGFGPDDRVAGVDPSGWTKAPDPREGWYGNTQVAYLAYQASMNPNHAEREADYQQIELLLHDDVARLWVAHNSTPLILSSKVGGFVPQPVGADYYEHMVVGSAWVDLLPGVAASLVSADADGSSTTVEIAAGAVQEAMTLVYAPLPDLRPSPGFFVTHGFMLAPHLNGELLSGLVFDIPLTVTIHYTDADVAGRDEEALEVRFWDGSTWSPYGVTLVSRDPANNSLVVTLAHLSKLALVIPQDHAIYVPLVQRGAALSLPAPDRRAER